MELNPGRHQDPEYFINPELIKEQIEASPELQRLRKEAILDPFSLGKYCAELCKLAEITIPIFLETSESKTSEKTVYVRWVPEETIFVDYFGFTTVADGRFVNADQPKEGFIKWEVESAIGENWSRMDVDLLLNLSE